MKHLKKFESTKNDNKIDELELFKQIYDENPDKDTHDFYMFLSKSEFVELPNGDYRKVPGIENMVRITPDKKSLGNMKGLSMRAHFTNAGLYQIWLPKEVRDEVENKNYHNIDIWLLELIGKHRRPGSDNHGRKVFNDVKDRLSSVQLYNL